MSGGIIATFNVVSVKKNKIILHGETFSQCVLKTDNKKWLKIAKKNSIIGVLLTEDFVTFHKNRDNEVSAKEIGGYPQDIPKLIKLSEETE